MSHSSNTPAVPASHTLPTAPLGTSPLSVSELCLGTNVFGWTVDEAGAHEILDAFVAAGGSFLDTANIYSGGTSEQFIGSWLAARGRRDDVVIATKVGMRMPDGTSGLAADYMRAQCDASRARLGVETIDLYYAHQPDPETSLVETLRTFDELVQAGHVRTIGLSNYSAEQVREALELCDEHGFVRPVALQPHYNLVDRSEFEGAVQQLAVGEQLAVAPYYGLASGFLTGKYQQDKPFPDSARADGVRRRYDNPRGWALLEAARAVAERHGVTVGQVAIAWLASRDAVTAPIASATSVAQLTELVGAFAVQLDATDLAELNAAG